MPLSEDKTANPIAPLLQAISACRICRGLPLGPRPIVQAHPQARILLAGQAPGQRTHHKAVPFDDVSGDRLRDWLGLEREVFYDSQKLAIVPMGFCYPGTGKSGDLPPRTECVSAWRNQILDALPAIELTVIIGNYALEWHLSERKLSTLTKTVANWKAYWPRYLPIPHPSPRNTRWLKQNAWFENEIIPVLQKRVSNILYQSR